MDFFNSIKAGDVTTVTDMLKEDLSLANSKDERQFPALVMAAYMGQAEIVSILLDHGADIDATDAAGNTTLMGVCFKGNTVILDQLLERGAKLDLINLNGASALIFAAMFGQLDVAQILLEHGADKTIKDNNGLTALDHARQKGFTGLIYLLS